MSPDSTENFRDVQYYAMLKDMYHAQHVVAKSAYGSYCACKECRHSWRGECMKERCACCTTPMGGR